MVHMGGDLCPKRGEFATGERFAVFSCPKCSAVATWERFVEDMCPKGGNGAQL